MFKEIFLFELKTWLKRPAIYLFFLLYFLITFLLIGEATGAFSGDTQDTNTYVNSAVVVASFLTFFSQNIFFGLITTIICVAIMGSCVQKDFEYNTHSFFFSRPISKSAYLFGRFFAAFSLTLLVLTGIIFGLLAGLAISPNDNGQIGPFEIMNFLTPFFMFTAINVLFIGVTFFSLVTFTRNLTTGYVSALVFMVISYIATTITSDLDNEMVAALVDPFGNAAMQSLTQYWTPSEQNERMIPLEGYVLYNRLLWFGISFLIGFVAYRKFEFSQFLAPVGMKKKKGESEEKGLKQIQFLFQLPKVQQYFNFRSSIQQLVMLAKFETKKVIRSVFFIIIVVLSVTLVAVVHEFGGLFYATETYPVTYQMLGISSILTSVFLGLLIIFYSGVVVWREKDTKSDELIFCTPVQTWVMFSAKLFALLAMCVTVYMVAIVTSIAIQTYEGYFNYELSLYFFHYFCITIFNAFVLCSLCVVIQTMVQNKFIGFIFITLALFGLPFLFRSLHWESMLLSFNSSGNILRYSDMNGYGHTLHIFYLYKGYWMGLMLILIALSLPMWPRLKEKSYGARMKFARRQFQRSYGYLIILGAVMFLGFGSYIFYNTRILNKHYSSKEQEKDQAEFEKKYKKCFKDPQPRIVSSNVEADIFPEEVGVRIKGYYYLKNKHREPLSVIYIGTYYPEILKELKLQTANVKQINDTTMGFFSYKLDKPMLPGDSIRLDFSVERFPKGFSEDEIITDVAKNGSFFNSMLLPYIGYNDNMELGDNATRYKYELPFKPRMAFLMDTAAYANTYIAKDADWIRFEATVSTIPSQIAIAPGYLEKEWEKEGRRYFHYKMDKPILNFYAFLSAEYAVARDKWIDPKDASKSVNIEIYHHPAHTYNVANMIKGVKKSLDYYTAQFSPYQHRQVRIIEFPRIDGDFAQSFPNTIPYSESVGFIAKTDSTDVENVNYPFYVTAHEVGHQWWAHQVIGADVQGATLMSETMAQYSALMVMQKEYGKPAMRRFLRYETDRYLIGRATEQRGELPMLFMENQQYIHYQKGSMVMYSLQDLLTEDSVNSAMRRYIKRVAFQEPPYTTSLDYYGEIMRITPDSVRQTVREMFERIIVFDNSVKDVSVEKSNKQYKVTLFVNTEKTASDSLGKAQDIKINDWIDIGVFAKNTDDSDVPGKELVFKKFKITGKEQKFEFIVPEEPYLVGIDPYNKLIDLAPYNNTKTCPKTN